jgi:hypothetical protein
MARTVRAVTGDGNAAGVLASGLGEHRETGGCQGAIECKASAGAMLARDETGTGEFLNGDPGTPAAPRVRVERALEPDLG